MPSLFFFTLKRMFVPYDDLCSYANFTYHSSFLFVQLSYICIYLFIIIKHTLSSKGGGAVDERARSRERDATWRSQRTLSAKPGGLWTNLRVRVDAP